MKLSQKNHDHRSGHDYPPHIRYPAKYLGPATKEDIRKFCRYNKIPPQTLHKYTCCYRNCSDLVVVSINPDNFVRLTPRSCGCSFKPYHIPAQHRPKLHSDPQMRRKKNGRRLVRYICRIPSGKHGTLCGKIFYAKTSGVYSPEHGINTLRKYSLNKSCGCLRYNRRIFWVIPPEWRKKHLMKTRPGAIHALSSQFEGENALTTRSRTEEVPCRMPGCPNMRKVDRRSDALGVDAVSCGCAKWKVKVPEEYHPTVIGEPSPEQLREYLMRHRSKRMDYDRLSYRGKIGRKYYKYHLSRCNIPYNNGKVCNTVFVVSQRNKAQRMPVNCGCIKKKPFLIPREWRIEPKG